VNVLAQWQKVFAQHGVDPSELRWTGRPHMGLLVRSQDQILIPESLLLAGFALFATEAILRLGGPRFNGPGFAATWVPAAILTFYAVIGRFMWDVYRRSVTYYGVTSDSALILQLQGLGGGLRRIYLPAIGSLGFDLASDGSGTIAFGDPNAIYRGSAWQWYAATQVPSFEGIPDARHVYALCEAARHSNASEDAQPAP
jgi:hypothetical protein